MPVHVYSIQESECCLQGNQEFPDNQDVPDATSQDRVGAGLYGANFLVVVHNGQKDPHLYWHYLDLGAGFWHRMGLCGESIDVGPIRIEFRDMDTEYAPALAFLPDNPNNPEKGRAMMVYANATDGSDQIVYSFLSEIG